MKWISLALLLFVISCSAPPQDGTTTTTSTTVTTNTTTTAAPAPTPEPSYPAPAPPAPKPQRNITIESVTVANPLVITGKARTFENNVALRVRNARGAVIAEDFTTATGDMGNHNPYRAEVWLTSDPGARITVEALEYSAKDGSEQSLVSVTQPYDVEIIDATLYLPDDNCERVLPETRRLPKSVAMARLLVEALVRERPFPKGSDVQSVILRDGVLTVDFNERLQNVGGSCAAQMIRASVTTTLSKLPSVKKVVITAGGSEKLALQP